jgi:hypothetical protein
MRSARKRKRNGTDWPGPRAGRKAAKGKAAKLTVKPKRRRRRKAGGKKGRR